MTSRRPVPTHVRRRQDAARRGPAPLHPMPGAAFSPESLAGVGSLERLGKLADLAASERTRARTAEMREVWRRAGLDVAEAIFQAMKAKLR